MGGRIVVRDVIGKIFLCLIFGVVILYMGFMALIFSAFSGRGTFFIYLIAFVIIGLIVFMVVKVFKLGNSKYVNRAFIVFFGICAIAIGGYEVKKNIHDSIPVVNDQGVNLFSYEPFRPKTLAVDLDGTSNLKITGDLPKLDGATALYPLYSAFARATYPEKEYIYVHSEVSCSNTVGAYERLIKGEADVIFAARPSKEQLELARLKGVELKLTPIGREAFVFFVNSKNSVKELSTKQIQSIYSGEITNWKEVGGKDEKIRAFQRPGNSGSQTMLQKLMEGKNLMAPPKEDVATGMGDIINQTASYRNYKNAIGYSFLFFATEMVKNKEIQLLKIDGVYPDRSTIGSREYPLTAEFYAVTAGTKNPNVKPLIEWVLSKQGQSLVEKTGYTPLNQ
jgi:phosphate transport system substrate-binding protein